MPPAPLCSLSPDAMRNCTAHTRVSPTHICVRFESYGTVLQDTFGRQLCVWDKTVCSDWDVDAHLVTKDAHGTKTLHWMENISLHRLDKNTVTICAHN